MVLETRLYNELNVTPDATNEQIRSAFKELVLQWHPDKNPNVTDAERFRAIKYAHKVLQDPKSRELYDNEGEEGLERQKNRKEETRNDGKYDFMQMVHKADISLKDLYSLNKRIFVTRICKTCEGKNHQCENCRGLLQQEKFNVNLSCVANVPPGTEIIEEFELDGEKFKPAILILKMIEVPHPGFKRDGYNLIMRLPIGYIESLTELNACIPTPNGRLLHISKTFGDTTKDKEKVTVQGCGLPYDEDGAQKFGDLLIFCRVERWSQEFNATPTPQMLFNALPPSQPTPDDDEIEECEIQFIQKAELDSFEDFLDPISSDEVLYDKYFNVDNENYY